MDELEVINRPERVRFYDKSDWEEDEPYPQIPDEIHIKYEILEKTFDEICGYDAKFAENESLKDRKNLKKFENEREDTSPNDFVYGEITFRTFSYIINHLIYKFKINIKKGIFYDLGSGSGRAIVAARMSFNFSNCLGIELLESLYNLSTKLKAKYREYSAEHIENKILSDNFDFIYGNILEHEYDYENTSMILANCKTFSKGLMIKIAEKLKPMPSGVILITTTQTLEDYDSDWQVFEKLRKLMSWGCANLYLHIKK